ncbi:MAG: DUF2075 domain-containing protein [Clostridiales bacterium]|nr:DUF2075 domain-containing protein [Candidatus Crickella caballi]
MATITSLDFNINVNDELKNIRHYGKDVGENWPVVYILNNQKEAYVGETHHASVRMAQHLSNAERRKLTEIRIITDKDFNKSVILDLEAFLIKHMGSDGKFKLQNANHGLQNHDYYNRSEYEEAFKKIWNKLRREGIVEHTIEFIENSNLFKYSPYKSLGPDQVQAEACILAALAETTHSDNGSTVIVRGGAGTGKTILAIYLMKLFSDINNSAIASEQRDYFDEDVESIVATESIQGIKKIGIVMPQSTLKASVKDVFNSVNGLSKNMVLGTTEVVEEYLKTNEKFDLIIVDEAHRLKCRWNGHLSSYPKFDYCTKALDMPKEKGNELDWIMKCSKNQIFFRDELQTVRPCDITAEDFKSIIEEYSNQKLAEVALSSQWRCEGGNSYITYIKNILSCIEQSPQKFENYEFKLYKDVDKMVQDIKAKNEEIGLCRNAAGYAWKWVSKKDKTQYDIEIQGHKYRWNTTYENWISKESSIDEIGCIHTLQGYDLNYVGLIIGEDLKFDTTKGEIYPDKTCYQDQQGKSGCADDTDALREYLTNIYLTLMSRGIKGTYLYVCDDNLRNYFEKYVEVVEYTSSHISRP